MCLSVYFNLSLKTLYTACDAYTVSVAPSMQPTHSGVGAERHQRIRSAPSTSVAVAVTDDATILGFLLPTVVLRVTVDAEAGRGELAGTAHLAELLRGDGADVDGRVTFMLAHFVSPFRMRGGFQFSPPSVMFGNILYDSYFIYTTR